MDYSSCFWLTFVASWALIGWTLGRAASKAVSMDSYEEHPLAGSNDSHAVPQAPHHIVWRRIGTIPPQRDG